MVGRLDVDVRVEPHDGADETVALAEGHRLVVEVEAVTAWSVVPVDADGIGEPQEERQAGDDCQADVEAA